MGRDGSGVRCVQSFYYLYLFLSFLLLLLLLLLLGETGRSESSPSSHGPPPAPLGFLEPSVKLERLSYRIQHGSDIYEIG